MRQIVKLTPLILTLLVIASSCKRDVLDLDKISNNIHNERNIAIPLILGEFSIKTLIEQDSDSLLTFDGDTVTLFFREDSIFTFEVADFAKIPQQPNLKYVIAPKVDIPTSGLEVIDNPTLDNDTIFLFSLNNDMRLDSVILNESKLVLTAENSFNYTIDLYLYSYSIISPSGENLSVIIENIPPLGNKTVEFNLNNYKVITFDNNGSSAINLNFHPIFRNTENATMISAADKLDIDFQLADLDDFYALYGFFGYLTETYDTNLTDILSEEMGNLSGELNVTNPKINLFYDQSIGISSKIDLNIEAVHYDKSNVYNDFPVSDINYSKDHLNPNYHGTISYNKNSVSNIDELIAIPIPNELNIETIIEVNKDKSSESTFNYAFWNSSLSLGLEVEVPLELRADATYLDTFDISNLVEDNVEIKIDYANLTYWFKNYFPLGFDAQLVLFDSNNNIRLDTIYLNSEPEKLFIEAASVNEKGDVLEESVKKHSGTIQLTEKTAENLLNIATHLILQATIQTTDPSNISSVRIGYNSTLEFQFGLDAGLTYSTIK